MKITEIQPDIFLITTDNQFELCYTFFRVQEFYESHIEEIRNNYFTIEKFIDKYAYLYNSKKPLFSYFEDWSGFNIPGNVFLRFYETFGTKLDVTEREMKLFNLIHKAIENRTGLEKERFYVIGAVDGEQDTIRHEMSHAFWYLNDDYRVKMKKLINTNHPMIPQASKWLLDKGYCQEVLDDEIQAYFSTGLGRKMITAKNKDLKFLNKFKKLFQEAYNGKKDS